MTYYLVDEAYGRKFGGQDGLIQDQNLSESQIMAFLIGDALVTNLRLKRIADYHVTDHYLGGPMRKTNCKVTETRAGSV